MNRKAVAIFIIMILLTACGGGDVTDHNEAIWDISLSSVHSDTLLVAVRSSSATEETTETEGEEVDDDIPRGLDSSADSGGSDVPVEPDGWRLTREAIISYAWETYGVSEEWTIWLIGTAWNEDYHQDRYLEYAWSCEILNQYRYWSVWDLDCIWGPHYSVENAYDGYYAADDTCLEMVWWALTDPDTRIVEVDGMIRWEVPGYYLIYDSEIYNCQVWGR